MDECRIGAVKAFHAKAHIELLLRRVDGSLQVQADVIQNETILELVISHERGAIFMMRGAKVIEVTTLDVSVEIEAEIPERFSRYRLDPEGTLTALAAMESGLLRQRLVYPMRMPNVRRARSHWQ